MNPAQRAQAIADAAKQRIETNIAREWWSVRKPLAEPMDVFFCPPQTHAEVLCNWPAYRHCGVLPL